MKAALRAQAVVCLALKAVLLVAQQVAACPVVVQAELRVALQAVCPAVLEALPRVVLLVVKAVLLVAQQVAACPALQAELLLSQQPSRT